jgi:hypothetical protein
MRWAKYTLIKQEKTPKPITKGLYSPDHNSQDIARTSNKNKIDESFASPRWNTCRFGI